MEGRRLGCLAGRDCPCPALEVRCCMEGRRLGCLVGRDCPCPALAVRCCMEGRRLGCLVGRDCPCPVAGRSLRTSCPSLTRRKPSLRNPCCARFPTPALGAQATPTGMRFLKCPKPTFLGFPVSGTQRGAALRSVPSASPRLDDNPRRRGHHSAQAARHRPPGRRPAGRRPGKLSGARDGPLSAER